MRRFEVVRSAVLVVLAAAVLAVPAGTTAQTQSVAVASVASETGQWEAPLAWPLVAVHAILQPNGKVLMWDGFGNGPNSQRLWDPATQTFTLVPNASNLFCSGHMALFDGRTMVFGGHIDVNAGLAQTNLFDWRVNTWARGADMARGRWYPTGTALGDGRVLVVSGDAIVQDNTAPITPLSIRARTVPELYDPRANTWTSMPTAGRDMPLYPFMFVLPDGRMLDAGPEQQTRTLDLATGTWSPLGLSPIDGHSAVMYRPGKVLKSGKWSDPEFGNLTVHGRAAVLDATVAAPAWREIAPMAFPRSYHQLVALPDGNVLAVGGGRTSEGTILANGVLQAEIWNASTETWSTMAPMQTSRLYHSGAMLLPDGRVLVVGGGALPGTAIDQTSAEIYSPPYLFRGPRPTITSAPTTVRYSGTFGVETPDAAAIASVGLVRTGAVTHSFDQNQRYVPLTFTANSTGVDVQAPANGNIAPPGYYMLFVVDTNGVPSVAKFVRLPAPWEDSVAPSAPSSLTATGGTGSASLMWSASFDDSGVAAYEIHRSTTPGFTPTAANRIAETRLTNYTDTGLAAGTYYYVVRARDAAGNVSAPSNVAFATATADTTVPTVSITAPLSGATVSGTVAVNADAADDVAIAGVRFLLDGAPLGAEDTTAPYSVDWDTRSGSNGLHSLTAVARDAAGNQTTSATVTVTVSNTVPAGLVAAYSFDAGTGVNVEDVSGTGNTGAISGATWSAGGRFGSALSFDGANDWVTVADAPSLDLAGATTLEAWVLPRSLDAVWRTVFIKEQPGELVYALYASSNLTTPNGIVFTSGAEHQAYGPAALPLNTWTHLAATYDGATVRFYVNGSLAGTVVATGPMPNSADPLRIGGNAVWGEWFDGLIDEIRVYNRALSATEIQSDMNSPVQPPPPPPPPSDTTAPTAPGALAATGSLGTVSLTWTASTDDTGVTHYNVHRSTTPSFTPSAANRIAQPTGTSYTDSGLAAGTYHYRVTAQDAVGNVSASSNEAAGTATADTTAPTVSLAAPVEGATVSGAIDVTAAASDDIGVGGVQFKLDGANLGGEDTVAPYTVTWDTIAAANGAHTLTAVARDAAGNTATATAVTVTVSNVPPPAPAVQLAPASLSFAAQIVGTTSAPQVVTLTNSGTAGLTVNSASVAGMNPADFAVNPGGCLGAVIPAGGSCSIPVTFAPRAHGLRSAELRVASDAPGSPHSVALSGEGVDTAAPAVAITAPADGARVFDAITVSASASDDVGVAGVQFVLDGVNLGAEDAAAPYSVAWDASTAAPGAHQLTAVARDAAGNRTVSAPVAVTVENGLVAAYSFNAGSGTTVADASGNGNTGTIFDATWTAAGRFGGALSFDSKGTVTIPDAVPLDLTTGMTLEAWVRPNAVGSWRTVAVKEGAGSIVYGLYVNSRAPGSSDGPSGHVVVDGAEAVARATNRLAQEGWSHLATTYDGATLLLYVNGTQVASRAATGPIATSAGALRIGGTSINNEWYRGIIDEVRVYRHALTATEIRSDMNTPIAP